VETRPVALHPLKRRVYTAYRSGGGSPAIEAMLAVLADTVAGRDEPAKAAVPA
jgi:hypothetical protein